MFSDEISTDVGVSLRSGARRPLVLANWKANGCTQSNAQLLTAITRAWQGVHQVEVVICPPAGYLHQVQELCAGSNIVLGAQDVSRIEGGAYTGEMTAQMLADLGCHYVVIGHSERRQHFAEADAAIAAKFQAAQRAGLEPILCVGETLAERDGGKALAKIGAQISAITDVVGKAAFSRALIAYEPIWAVGSGRVASAEQIAEVHRFIRAQFGDLGARLRILYGGSVKPDNASKSFALEDVDGALIGGASLKADDFLAICRAAN